MTTSLAIGPAGSFASYFIKSMITARTPPPRSLDLSGQTAIITGGYTGLGYECAAILLSQKLSHLIITVRNQTKGNGAASKLQDQYPNAKIECWFLDMLDYDSIQAFANQCNELSRIDMVVLNAGVVVGKFKPNENTKHEETFSVNYLSTALLSLLLLPVLRTKRPPHNQPSRLTIVGSGLALAASFPERKASVLFSAFDDEKYFNYMERYSTTKLLLLLFVSKLAEYVDADDVIINVSDPGYVDNPGLDRDLSGPMRVLMAAVRRLMAKSLKSGAWAYVDAVTVKGKSSHGGWVANWVVHAFPKIMYTGDGKKAGCKLWEETLAEFEWAGVRGILASMGKGST
ncbi:uncharacterized protein BDV17DRAFT_301290 [Aspergillus undulatus]|uniref:uncharacterized protein n=1 Tax=Aspergillus undulatus TaxID=1810928 RepID=UPI003CCE0B78